MSLHITRLDLDLLDKLSPQELVDGWEEEFKSLYPTVKKMHGAEELTAALAGLPGLKLVNYICASVTFYDAVLRLRCVKSRVLQEEKVRKCRVCLCVCMFIFVDACR